MSRSVRYPSDLSPDLSPKYLVTVGTRWCLLGLAAAPLYQTSPNSHKHNQDSNSLGGTTKPQVSGGMVADLSPELFSLRNENVLGVKMNAEAYAIELARRLTQAEAGRFRAQGETVTLDDAVDDTGRIQVVDAALDGVAFSSDNCVCLFPNQQE